MREVTIKFVTEPSEEFRVEIKWSPKSGIATEDAFVDRVLRPSVDVMLKAILPKEYGYGEGDSPEEAKMKAFIERDIGRAGRKQEVGVTSATDPHTPLPWELDHQAHSGIDHLCIVNHESKQVVCSMSPWETKTERDYVNAGIIIAAVTAAMAVLEKQKAEKNQKEK